MQLRLGTMSLLAAASMLAGCGGFQAQRSFDEVKAAKPQGDAYHQALYEGYLEHTTYEQVDMMNYTSAMAHGRKALDRKSVV